MTNQSRRSILQLSAVGALGTSSGCFDAFGESEEEIQFCEARVFNEGATSHEVQIRITEGDTVRYEEETELVTNDEEGDNSLQITASDLPSSEGAFALKIRVDTGEWEETELTPEFAEPAVVTALIGTGESVSFFKSLDENRECEF